MRASGHWQGAVPTSFSEMSSYFVLRNCQEMSSNMQVPIQRLRKQGPAGGTPAAKPPSRKRARQAAAGATALLGLFSFFVLAGPFAGITMLPVRTSLVSEGSMSPLAPSLARQGRVLTTAEDMLPLHTMAQTSMLHSSGPEPSHIWRLNETEPVVLMPTDLEAQDMALQQLKVGFEVALHAGCRCQGLLQPCASGSVCVTHPSAWSAVCLASLCPGGAHALSSWACRMLPLQHCWAAMRQSHRPSLATCRAGACCLETQRPWTGTSSPHLWARPTPAGQQANGVPCLVLVHHAQLVLRSAAMPLHSPQAYHCCLLDCRPAADRTCSR